MKNSRKNIFFKLAGLFVPILCVFLSFILYNKHEFSQPSNIAQQGLFNINAGPQAQVNVNFNKDANLLVSPNLNFINGIYNAPAKTVASTIATLPSETEAPLGAIQKSTAMPNPKVLDYSAPTYTSDYSAPNYSTNNASSSPSNSENKKTFSSLPSQKSIKSDSYESTGHNQYTLIYSNYSSYTPTSNCSTYSYSPTGFNTTTP